jgi:ABC-2 type transport system permease protein
VSTTIVPSVTAPIAKPARLAGTGALVRFALLRDRVRLSIWVGGLTLYTVLVAASFPGIYPEEADRQARAMLIDSPGAVAMSGPGIGLDDYTFGAMMTNEMLGLTVVAVALMSIFTVVRHTRADEESGRTELVLGSPVGRQAPLAAALAVAALANVVLAALTAAGLASLGIESIDWPGSWIYGAAYAAVGLVFAGLAAVTVHLTEHARAASSLAGLGIGVAYALRALGDISAEPLSWLSPIGWAQRTYAYVDNRWWPLLLALVVAGLLAALAFRLGARRDLGAGLRPPRPGPSDASDALASLHGLALRLQRAALIGWVVAMVGFGLLYGSIFGEVEDFAEEMEAVSDIFASFGTDDIFSAYLSLIVMLVAMTASVYAVIATLRAQSEERAGRAEELLATPVSRARWLLSQAGVAAAGGVAVLFAGAIGIGISGSAALGDAGVMGDVLAGSLVQIAPVLLVVALAVALYGLLPAATGAVWAVVGYAVVVGMLGGLLGLPQWTMDISPFALVPMVPAEAFTPWPVLAMLAVAAALMAAGVWGLGRRDLHYGG